MNRRRRSSPGEDLIDLVARLPWWAALAIAFYFGLEQIADRPPSIETQPGQVAAAAVGQVWRTLASIGQYLLPVLCIVGAALSAWRRRERQALIGTVGQSPAAEALNGMSWQQFERLVGEAFRQDGYRVVDTGGGGADGGVDLVVSRNGETFLVQCKQWRAFKVGVEVVRELYGVMAARGAAGGFVVTSGRFTTEAQAFAEGRNLQLLDGKRLHEMIRRARPVGPAEEPSARSAARSESQPTSAAPNCPACAGPMIVRKAKRGTQAGRAFWGCQRYPDCRGTRSTP